MNDASVIAEAVLLCSIPFALMAAGVFLRRKAWRWTGGFLLWSGVAVLLLAAVFTLNYLGKI